MAEPWDSDKPAVPLTTALSPSTQPQPTTKSAEPWDSDKPAVPDYTYKEAMPGVKPPPKASGSILDSLIKGVATGVGTSPEEQTALSDPYSQEGTQNAVDQQKEATTSLPESTTGLGGAAKGVGEALVNPLSYVGGPLGVSSSVASGAVSGWRHAVSPDTPGWNALWGAIAGVGAPSVLNTVNKAGHIAGEGLGLFDRPELVQAWQDQGITGRTAAGVGENSMPKTVRTYRESPTSNAIGEAESLGNEQLQTAIDRQAGTLGNATTPQEAGTHVQGAIRNHIDTTRRLISAGNNALNTVIDPTTTNVPMGNTFGRLIDALAPTPGAVNQSSRLLPKAQGYLEALQNDIIDRNNRIPGNNDALPLAAIKEVKRNIGDLLEQSIMNGDTSKRQLNIIYGNLAEAERSAYANTPYAQQFADLQNMSSGFYRGVEQYLEPLVKQGVTPERIAQQIKSGVNIGDTKLTALFNEVPAARGPIASETLRNLGLNNSRQFDANTFFKNWQKVSPTARQTLFGSNGQLPADYDQLALLAQRQGESQAARNFSGTGGVSEGFGLARRFFNSVTALAGAGVGGMLGHTMGAHQIDGVAEAIGGMGGAGIGIAASPLVELAADTVVPKLLTNPAFVRWLATPTPMGGLPMHMRALTAIAGANPEISNEVAALQNYAKDHPDNAKGFLGGGYAGFPNQSVSGFAEGGQVGPLVSANANNPPIQNSSTHRLRNDGWDQVGVAMPFNNTSIVDQILSPGLVPKPAANEFAEGGWIDLPPSANRNTGEEYGSPGMALPFKNSSILDQLLNPKLVPKQPASNDNNKFALGGLTNVPHMEYANGGFLESSVMGYADGGTIPPPRDSVPPWMNESPTRGTLSAPGLDQIGATNNLKGEILADAKAPANDKFGQAIGTLTKLGVDPEVAKGAIKYMYLNESKLDPNAINKTSGAFGIGQMLGPRKDALFAKYGDKPTYDNQLDHIGSELSGSEKKVLQALLSAKGEKAGYDIWGSMFERPGSTALAKAGVNYKSGDVTVAGNKKNDQSVVDQFIPQAANPDEDQEEVDQIDNENAPTIKAINDAPWAAPVTKYAATRILSEHA